MTDFGAGWDLLILVVVSFIPALVYLSWIRGTERYGKEGWGPLLRAFVYGAIFATITAAILEGSSSTRGRRSARTTRAPSSSS